MTFVLGASPGGVMLGDCRVRAGASSWADPSLIKDGSFYPRKSMTARERLGYYTTRLPVAEIATTFRFPPTPELAEQWVERTPDGFVFDVRAWSLFTGSPTLPDSLWPDLVREVRPEKRDCRRLYPAHLSDDALDECWTRFADAIDPLRRAGRLGVVIFAYPSWFGPRAGAWEQLNTMRHKLRGLPLAVELPNHKWWDGTAADVTLEWLEDHDIGLVCVDGPDREDQPAAGVVAATASTTVVRFSGRRAVDGEPWTWPYRYRRDELASWVPRIAALAASSTETHLLFENTSGSDAVDGALTALELLAG